MLCRYALHNLDYPLTEEWDGTDIVGRVLRLRRELLLIDITQYSLSGLRVMDRLLEYANMNMAVEMVGIFGQRSIILGLHPYHWLILRRHGENCFQEVCGAAIGLDGWIGFNSDLLMPMSGIVTQLSISPQSRASIYAFSYHPSYERWTTQRLSLSFPQI